MKEFGTVAEKVGKIVKHFKHSNVATAAFEKKQAQLELKKECLVQSCPTRWDSTYSMCETFLRNKAAIFAVLADRSITTCETASKLGMTVRDWTVLEEMTLLLKPLKAATKVFCSDSKVTLSAVRPVIRSILDNHFTSKFTDSNTMEQFKTSITKSLTLRFDMAGPPGTEITHSGTVLTQQIAQFLDPRYKDLRAEGEEEAPRVRDHVREKVCEII